MTSSLAVPVEHSTRERFRLAAGLFFSEAARALSRNKLRSALTSLGMTIGIAAVVCVIAIGEAGSRRAQDQLLNLGDNLVWVEAGSRVPSGVRTGTHGTTSLTMEDAEAIRREVPAITRVSPHVDASVQVVFGNKNWRTRYRGVSPEYLRIRRWNVAAGEPFDEQHVVRSANVAVIGQTVREQLFGRASPVGEQIRVAGHIFEVLGVLAVKGQSAFGQDQDDTILIPFTTAQKKLRGRGVTWLDDVMCSARSAQEVNVAVEAITSLLRQRHHIAAGAEDDFNLRRPDEVIKAQIETSRTLAILLASIASISLLVGGIGIMNVMLVSVAERTREIGVRMAVGATGSHVRMQFLGEAVVLSLFGGGAGVALGVLASFVLGRTLQWGVTIPASAVLIAPVVAATVGVVFGVYPAGRAAHLDPIEALRYE